jgi:hypothetical protein
MLQPPSHGGSSLADFFFYPEDSGDTFLRNVGVLNVQNDGTARYI